MGVTSHDDVQSMPPNATPQGGFAVEIPLHNRAGLVVGYAQVDREYGHLARLRWHALPSGYVVRSWKEHGRSGKTYLHRVVLSLTTRDGLEGDHVNHDRWDNRRENLRIVTDAQNSQNLPPKKHSTSRFRGVSWDSRRSKWAARAKCGELQFVKRFDSETAAHEAVRAWRIANMPFTVEA